MDSSSGKPTTPADVDFNERLKSVLQGETFREQVTILRKQGVADHERRKKAHPELYEPERSDDMKRAFAVAGGTAAVGIFCWYVLPRLSISWRARPTWQRVLFAGAASYLVYRPAGFYARQGKILKLDEFPRSRMGDVDCPSVLYSMRQAERLDRLLKERIAAKAAAGTGTASNGSPNVATVVASGATTLSTASSTGLTLSTDGDGSAIGSAGSWKPDVEVKPTDTSSTKYWRQVCGVCARYLQRVETEERTSGEVSPTAASSVKMAATAPLVAPVLPPGSTAGSGGAVSAADAEREKRRAAQKQKRLEAEAAEAAEFGGKKPHAHRTKAFD